MPNAKDLVLRLRSVTDSFRTDEPVRELDDLEQSLRATSKQATQSARETKRAADDLDAPGFDRAGDEAERTARRMRDAAEDMERGIRDGARGIDTATDRIRDDLAETGKEAGSEFVSNIAEGIGSGQANLNDIVQGTLGGITNLAGSIPGVGTAIALAAVPVGLFFSSMQKQSEKAKERIDNLRDALADVADKAGEAAEKAIFESWIEDAQQTTGKIENVVNVLDQAGVTSEEWKQGLAGNPAVIDRIIGRIDTQNRKLDHMRDTGQGLTDDQLDYLNNAKMVTQELTGQDAAIGAIRREAEAIDELTGSTAKKARSWTGDLNDAAGLAAAIRRDIEAATKPRTVKIRYDTRDSTGRPINLSDPRLTGRHGLGTSQ